MHTIVITSPNHGEIRVEHNADWSADAIITWREGNMLLRAEVPAVVLQQVGRIATLREVIGVLEQMDCAPTAIERPRQDRAAPPEDQP